MVTASSLQPKLFWKDLEFLNSPLIKCEIPIATSAFEDETQEGSFSRWREEYAELLFYLEFSCVMGGLAAFNSWWAGLMQLPHFSLWTKLTSELLIC